MSLLFLGWIALGLALVGWVIVNPVLETPGSRLVGILGLALIPALISLGGVNHQLQQSKRTEFCLSCHEMEPYGRSLRVDDAAHLQAAHYQNSRIPREQACYICHTEYTMFGDVRSKWTGLRHLVVHYFGEEIETGTIALYQPYRNRECLRCHEGARSFEEGEGHQGVLEEIRSNEISCLDCHSGSHGVAELGTQKLWHPNGGDGDGGG